MLWRPAKRSGTDRESGFYRAASKIVVALRCSQRFVTTPLEVSSRERPAVSRGSEDGPDPGIYGQEELQFAARAKAVREIDSQQIPKQADTGSQ